MKRYVSSPWGQVHLREEGHKGPALVLLHESPLSSQVYEPVLPLLATRARAIAIDTPGYGASDGPPGRAEIPEYAATMLGALDDLGVGSFAVVGVHTGASLAIQMALQAPERVTHAVLSGVPLFSPTERQQYLDNWAPEVDVEADGGHFLWAWQRYQRIWGGPPELLHLAATTLLGNLSEYHRGYLAAFRYDPEPDLPSVVCPVLLYTAEHDLLIGADRIAADRFPDAVLETVPGQRGQLPLRIPEAFTDRVLRFVLEERPPAGSGRA